MSDFTPNQIFFVTEGINSKGDSYETTMSIAHDDTHLMELFLEFLRACKKGPARIMLSNRKDEDWE